MIKWPWSKAEVEMVPVPPKPYVPFPTLIELDAIFKRFDIITDLSQKESTWKALVTAMDDLMTKPNCVVEQMKAMWLVQKLRLNIWW